MTTMRTELQQRAQSTLIQYAFFRWESAVILGLTIILTFLLPRPFFWWPRFGWPLLGLIVGRRPGLFQPDRRRRQRPHPARHLSRAIRPARHPATRNCAARSNPRSNISGGSKRKCAQQSPGVIRDRLEDTAGQIDGLAQQHLPAGRAAGCLSSATTCSQRERNLLPQEIDQLLAQAQDRKQRRRAEATGGRAGRQTQTLAVVA